VAAKVEAKSEIAACSARSADQRVHCARYETTCHGTSQQRPWRKQGLQRDVVFYHRHWSPVDADKYLGDLAKKYELRKRLFDGISMMGRNHCDRQHRYKPSTHFSVHLFFGCPACRECATSSTKDVQDAVKKKIHKNVRSCFTVVTCLTECGSAEDDRLSQTVCLSSNLKFPNRCRPKNVNSRV
jgi:hypothetical protein